MVVIEHRDKDLYLCGSGTGKCWYQYRIFDYSNTGAIYSISTECSSQIRVAGFKCFYVAVQLAAFLG